MRESRNRILVLTFYHSLLLIATTTSALLNTLNITQSIIDGETLVSNDGIFALGFFSPGSSTRKYLGIWYHTIPDRNPVWVANREEPLDDSSGILKITKQGVLVLLNQNGSVIWSSNVSRPARNPVAKLLDSGNLVVKNQGDENSEDFLWQSFDHPCDTFLADMKIGVNRITGLERLPRSWKTADDPSPGNYSAQLEFTTGYPEFYIKRGSTKLFRFGPWNGQRFSGILKLNQTDLFRQEYVFNQEEVYWSYRQTTSIPLRGVLSYEDGSIRAFAWNNRTQGWTIIQSLNIDDCDVYARCGAYSSCSASNALCVCLEGFVPTNPKDWDAIGLSNSCVRKTQLNCKGDGFRKYSGLKLPETENSWFNVSMNLGECKNVCLKNCSCTAYTNLDVREGGSGCLLWFNDLIDIRQFNNDGQDIYIRMAASDADDEMSSATNLAKRDKIVLISVLPAGVLFLVLVLVLLYVRGKRQKAKETDWYKRDDLDLPLFDLDIISSATNGFSDTNKLGKGGYGPVYKGRLQDGQEIAVKRLSESSKQGLQEFKNEVSYIAKLQHRNLVKLLGCCIQEDEKILIYEFMPNKSLDFFIFDETLSTKLDWQTRFHIINGIARGILYLHQDSRLQIIHRDLKASNVLLDYEMNPKISDFGLARSFGENETKANTSRVVGTYGYMSPEYTMDGLYSVKSDVFSFGVIVLEIVSGKRNRGFYHPENHLNLLGHAWKLHKEGATLELVAEAMRNLCNITEVVRSIHIGLLCVQRSMEDRPNMSEVVFMLGGGGLMDDPKQPGFFIETDIHKSGSSSSSANKSFSANKLSITQLEAR